MTNYAVAVLSERGMDEVGHIFQDGKVPLRHVFPRRASIVDYEGLVFMADWSEFTEEQKLLLTDFMIEKREIPQVEVLGLLEASGFCVPLREEMVKAVVWSSGLRDLAEAS